MATRTGSKARSIFESPKKTTKSAASSQRAPATREPGRPNRLGVEGRDWRKVNVVLTTEEILWLDRLALDIRQKTGSAVSRAELIRAVVDAVMESGLDLTVEASESAVKSAVSAALNVRK